MAVVLAVLGCLFFKSFSGDMIYTGDSPTFYIRRIFLCVCGVAGVIAWQKSAFPHFWDKIFWALCSFSWKSSWATMGMALALGIFCAWFSFDAKAASDVSMALVLTPLVVFCEEAFFRGFLLNVLYARLQTALGAILLASLFSSLYFLTFNFIGEQGWYSQLYRVGLSYIGLSLPLSLFYWRTKSFPALWFCHGVINFAALLRVH